MYLLVDIGNSRIKWAVLEAGRLSGSNVLVPTGAALRELLGRSWGALDRPQRVLVSSVGEGEANSDLSDWVSCRWQRVAEFAVSQPGGHGVVNAYSDPTRLGVDRWLCLLAAWSLYRSRVCIVDCGTAVTLDLLDESGVHQGGLIIPGLETMKKSLIQGTSAIRDVRPASTGFPGSDTASAIHNGTLLAVRGMIRQTLEQLEEPGTPAIPLVLTGGDAARVAEGLEGPLRVIPELVLQGLAVHFGLDRVAENSSGGSVR